MAILSTGNTFGATDTVTSTKLNNIANAATFDDPVDDSTLELHTDGKLRVKDDGITADKISTGGPSWSDSESGDTTVLSSVNGAKIELYPGLHPSSRAKVAVFSADRHLFRSIDESNENKMWLNNEGTLTVGTFDPNLYDNTGDNPGIALHGSGSGQHGLITSARYNSTAAAFNRTGSDGNLVGMRREGVAVGSISVTASATAYNTSSDYRLKQDVVDMEGSIERLKALKPCNFAWKVNGERTDGFIAHEAQQVVPEAVTGVKDAVDDEGNPEYQGIDQSKLVPLLTKSLQEAVARIESLEAKVVALEAK